MNVFFTFILLTMVVARVTRLIAIDTLWKGTRENLLTELRDPIKSSKVDDDGNITNIRPRRKTNRVLREKLATLIECPYCVSVHAAGWLTLVMVIFTDAPMPYPILWWPALAMTAVIVLEYTDGQKSVVVQDGGKHTH